MNQSNYLFFYLRPLTLLNIIPMCVLWNLTQPISQFLIFLCFPSPWDILISLAIVFVIRVVHMHSIKSQTVKLNILWEGTAPYILLPRGNLCQLWTLPLKVTFVFPNSKLLLCLFVCLLVSDMIYWFPTKKNLWLWQYLVFILSSYYKNIVPGWAT